MYRVRWEGKALIALAALWVSANSAERKAITAASHQVDQRLRRDPENEGESRPKGRRIMFEAPLAVVFRIEPDGRTVSVLQVRMFRKRGS